MSDVAAKTTPLDCHAGIPGSDTQTRLKTQAGVRLGERDCEVN